jgi:hypothetical protein
MISGPSADFSFWVEAVFGRGFCDGGHRLNRQDAKIAKNSIGKDAFWLWFFRPGGLRVLAVQSPLFTDESADPRIVNLIIHPLEPIMLFMDHRLDRLMAMRLG